MEIIIHRVNTIGGLQKLSPDFGAEIDIRAQGSKLILNHEPFETGDVFADWLENYRHGTLVLNIKEAGIESEVLSMVRSKGIVSYFLLDVEFPYLYKASLCGERNIAIRYSEEEPIETVERYRKKVDWVWIDTFTKLPLDTTTVEKLKGFKTCLVCPERWQRAGDIAPYRDKMQQLKFYPDAVMTALPHSKDWK